MLDVKPDFYNAIFNNELAAPNVQTIRIDFNTLDLIDPDVVTIDNVWNICVLLSMLVVSKDHSVLCKDDVQDIRRDHYWGKPVIDEIKARLLTSQSRAVPRSTIERAYAGTTLYQQFREE